MRDTTSDMSGEKRKAHLTTSEPATSKRLRTTINPATDQELGEAELEEEADDNGHSSAFSLLV